MSGTKQVACLIETSKSYGRGILRGINRYVREHGRWSLFLEPRDLSSQPPSWLDSWRGDGILARVSDANIARAVFRTNLPAVNLSSALPELGLPCIESNPHTQCRLAAQHLLERGFRHFAFVGDSRQFRNWSAKLVHQFNRVLDKSGRTCHLYEPEHSEEEPSWEAQQRALAHWIAGLPKPIGVLAINDPVGRQVLDACRRAEVAVPDAVAVIGLENDELVCEMADPPLSSVVLNAQKVGYEAAALLDRMMAGRQPNAGTLVTVEPLGVVTRQSTDVQAHEDAVVGQAVRFIRQYACEGITVREVITHVGVSRSSLDRRFKGTLGRTPHEEIAQVHLNQARQLLTETNLPLAEVARRSGFKHAEYMGVVFRKTLGVTPGQYRKEANGKG